MSHRIDRFVEAVREHWRVPGVAVTLARRDGPVHVRTYGVKNVELGAPADTSTAFAIGSCSKAFTAALAAILVDEGKLGWDDPIRKYLPNFQLHDPWISDRITLRDVLANRTGLSRAGISEYGSDLSRAEVLSRARDIEPIAGFRDQFTYSNLGFVAATEAMAAAAGVPFERLMQEHVFAPLGTDNYSIADAPLVRYASLCFEHQGDQEIPPREPLPLSGDRSWIRFHDSEGRITSLDWSDWFGTARFSRV